MKPKVLLLYNHDNLWSPQEAQDAAHDRELATEAMRHFGYEVHDAMVMDSVAQALHPLNLNPREWLVFNWCEGYADRPWAYDDVTRELDELGLVYTGSDTVSLGMSADKAKVQAALLGGGVPVPQCGVLHAGDPIEWTVFPAIVKPANQHGSFGIDRDAVVLDRAQLADRLEYIAASFHSAAVVEEFIDGRELQVTVWGNRTLEVLPEVEVVFNNDLGWRDCIYTYEVKFHADALEAYNIGFVCPSMLTIPQRRAVERACRRAFRAMRCRDYARVDLRLRGKRVYVLDVNPNPDINSEALIVIAANMVGLHYDDVIARIVQAGEARWRAWLKATHPSAKRLPALVPQPV